MPRVFWAKESKTGLGFEMGVCNLDEGIGGALEESCFSSSKVFSFLPQNLFLCTFYQKDLKRTPNSPIFDNFTPLRVLTGPLTWLGTEYCVRIVMSLSRGRSFLE